jgi:hypothetical protein
LEGSSVYKEYAVILPDFHGWGGGDEKTLSGCDITYTSDLQDKNESGSKLDEVIDSMKNAHIDATFTKDGDTVSLNYVITSTTGESYNYTASFTGEDTSEGLYVFFVQDNSDVTVTLKQDATKANETPSVYVQYKKQTDGTYTVRVIAEVALSEGTFETSSENDSSENASYTGAGFRCAKAENTLEKNEAYTSTVVFKSIMANGNQISATGGKYFIVTEITDVGYTDTIYVNPVYTTPNADAQSFTETVYEINMKNIIK